MLLVQNVLAERYELSLLFALVLLGFPPFWFLRYQNLVFHSQPTNPHPKKEGVRPFWSCTPPIYASESDISSAITPSRTPNRNLPKSRIFLRLRMNNTSAAELSIVIHFFSLLTLYHSISLLLLLRWRRLKRVPTKLRRKFVT